MTAVSVRHKKAPHFARCGAFSFVLSPSLLGLSVDVFPRLITGNHLITDEILVGIEQTALIFDSYAKLVEGFSQLGKLRTLKDRHAQNIRIVQFDADFIESLGIVRALKISAAGHAVKLLIV